MLIVLYLIMFLSGLLAPSTAEAETILWTDDFDDGQLSEWQEVRSQQHHHPDQPCLNAGQSAKWEIKNGQAGIVISGGPSCETELIPTGLNLEQVNNFEVEFDWYLAESIHMDRNMLLMWQDEHNWYGVKLLDTKIKLQKIIDGEKADLYFNWGFYPFEAEQSYHFRVQRADSIISLWVEDELVFQTVDGPPYINGYYTPGLQASTGAIVRSSSWFDNFVVRSLDIAGEKKLNVPLYQQTNSRWKNHEYDQASEWSHQPTIQRWGCALSSAVMILNYYGINQLPNDHPVNPAYLNVWLKDQPDGYVGQGLVNWLALTRLSHELSPILDTPSLEFGYLDANNHNQVIQQLEQNQPVIVQIPGHFLVADGYPPNQDDLYIKDPAYNYHLLSEHEEAPLSFRTLTPSQTDLSYLLLVTEPTLKVKWQNSEGQTPAKLQIYSEYLQAFEDENQAGTEIKLFQSLPKPASGEYQLLLETESEIEQLVELYAYDVQGQVKVFSQPVTTATVLNLNYDSQSMENTTLKPESNPFISFKLLLTQFYQTHHITVKYAYLKLHQLANWAESDTDNHDRYQHLILDQLDQLKEFISPTAAKKLKQILIGL